MPYCILNHVEVLQEEYVGETGGNRDATATAVPCLHCGTTILVNLYITHIHTHTHTHVYIYVYVYIYILYIYIIYTHTYIYTYIIYTHTYIYTYIYTHIHIGRRGPRRLQYIIYIYIRISLYI